MTPRAQKSLRIIGLALAASLICALALAQTPTPRNVAGPPCTALTRHWAIHAGYRALLYKSPPAYVATGFDIPTAGNLTFSNEPVLGLTYRFHPTREE